MNEKKEPKFWEKYLTEIDWTKMDFVRMAEVLDRSIEEQSFDLLMEFFEQAPKKGASPFADRVVWSLKLPGKKMDFRKKFIKAGMAMNMISESAVKSSIAIVKTPIVLNLGVFELRELGFEEKVGIDAILKRAQEMGLRPCPPEVGPRLRLKFKNQLYDDTHYIGMTPVVGSGYLVIFTLEYCDTRYGYTMALGCSEVKEEEYPPKAKFIFVIEEKPTK